METDAPKPVVFSMNELLLEVGGANTTIISVGSSVCCISLVSDGERVACGCDIGVIAIVNVHRSVIEVRWRAHESTARAIDVGNDGLRGVSGSRDKTAKMWDAQSGECLKSFNGHSDLVLRVLTTEDGKRVISGSIDGKIEVWGPKIGLSVGAPIYPNVFSIVWLCSETRNLPPNTTCSSSLELEIWNLTTHAKVGTLFH